LRSADFVCAARRYWLSVFPRVAREVHRRRVLAMRIPDSALRGFALQALERKRGNLEGAAAFATLVPRASRPAVVSALVACQAICDYLDLLSEQPNRDPIANGYRLHEALVVATTRGEPHRDYYAHYSHDDDDGYLRTLVDGARAALSALPSLPSIVDPLGQAAERIAVYQSLNHGDANGSHEPFERWATQTTTAHAGLRPWETAAGAGSTLAVFALIASAADPRLRRSVVHEIENAYFPWIGSLHSLLDSLVDYDEDVATEGRALVGHYPSPHDAANRMGMIAGEAMDRAAALPGGRRHALIVAAMTSFYLCELHGSRSPHAQLVSPSVLDAIGGLAVPTMAILSARRSLRGVQMSPSGVWSDAGSARLESQVPDFPLFFSAASGNHSCLTRTDAHSVPCPPGGQVVRPRTLRARVCGRTLRLGPLEAGWSVVYRAVASAGTAEASIGTAEASIARRERALRVGAQ
jgi:tetraprenyl-beta-curcumene synthase